jgi:putative ABC transport system ATP-binding protein
MTPILQTNNLQFSHDGKQRWQFDDINLRQGEHMIILGDSGSGKTTLLHLLSGLLTPTSGSIWVDGNDLGSLKKSTVDDIRGTKIGMVFQRPHFIKSLNAIENVELAVRLSKNKSQTVKNNCLEQLTQLNIGNLATKKIQTLSEGEKQRVGIARAVANNPLIILADEPTSALDDKNCEAVIHLLIDVSKKSNCALVVVTHDARIKKYFPNQMTITS